MRLFLRFTALLICIVGYVRCQGLNPCVPDPPPLGKCPCHPTELGLKRPHPNPVDCEKYFECVEDGNGSPPRTSQFIKSCTIPGTGFNPVSLDCQIDPYCFGVTFPPTTPTTPDPLMCPPSGEANIPDESDCNSFIICVNGEATPSRCPDGWTFDFTSGQCLLYGGICWPGSSPPTGSPGTPPAPTDPPTTPLPPECPLQGEVNIPDKRDCNGYIRCVDGIPTFLRCPVGWTFDYISRQCLPFSGTCWPGSDPVTGTPLTFPPIDGRTTELTPQVSAARDPKQSVLII